MKKALLVLYVGLARLVVAQEVEPAVLTKLRANHQAQVEAAAKPLRDSYARELEALEKSLTMKGDLDGALAVRREREMVLGRIANPLGLPKGETAPLTNPPSIPEWETARSEYRKKLDELQEANAELEKKRKELEDETQRQLSNPLNRTAKNRLRSLTEVKLEKEEAALRENLEKARGELRKIKVKLERAGIPLPK